MNEVTDEQIDAVFINHAVPAEFTNKGVTTLIAYKEAFRRIARNILALKRDAKPPMGEWQHALDDELICCHLGTTETFPDPREALRQIINWHVAVALDPTVSSAAQALIDRGIDAALTPPQAEHAHNCSTAGQGEPESQNYSFASPPHERAAPAAKDDLPIVAWMDDGQQATNGTMGTAFRVVTEQTRVNMPKAAIEPYTDPLVRKADAIAYAEAIRKAAPAPEPVYQLERPNGDWTDVDEAYYKEMSLRCAHRTLYAAPSQPVAADDVACRSS